MTPSERLLRQFRDLVTVRLERITRSLMELESGASAEAGRGVLRELHGLKGEARMMGFDDVNVLVHEMEELVRCTEPLRYALSPASTDALLTTADAVLVFSGTQAADEPPPTVERLVAWLQECVRSESVRLPPGRLAPAATASPEAGGGVGTPGGPSAAVQASPGAAPGRLLTVPVAEGSRPLASSPGRSAMPSLVTPQAAGTAASSGGGARGASPAPTAKGANGLTAPRQPEPRPDTAVRIGVESLDLLTSAVTNLTQVARRRELANARRLALARELSQLAREAEDLGPAGAALAARLGSAKEMAAVLHRESKLLSNAELRDLGMLVEEVQTLRMLPLSVLFEPYPRMVRDLSRALGKEVELVVDGEDTRADRAVVEALREPLMHLVRNALDHGLETRVDRVTADKKPRGCLTLRAAREGNRIILRVEDDGMGVDPAQLRKVAVRRGLFDESAANALSDAAARELIFLPGFTSRDVVTDLSGRGVGLDAVRASIQALGGDVGVESAPGWGTIFELRVPVSLTVAPLLFIQVGTETLALSATHVSRALKVDTVDQCEVAGRPSLLVEGRVLPLAPLSSLLGLGPSRPALEGELALVVKSQSGAAALVVDRVLEERVQAILPLKGILGRFGHLTGATSLADGRLAMVLSAAFLTASAHQGNALPRPPPSVAPA
uniref:chemotaxis protein CheA n=1 Tax=Myxococcus vastator TaxID=2709664 RepID=UPI0013D1FD23